jgi:hypothetical protein
MNAHKNIRNASKMFIGFSILNLAYVSLLSIYSPQATMNYVATPLLNNDAISSIRGIYGGVGLVVTFTLIYLLLEDVRKGLVFLSLFWGAYSLSRIITIFVDGPLGTFGLQWLKVESTLCILALILLLFYDKTNAQVKSKI